MFVNNNNSNNNNNNNNNVENYLEKPDASSFKQLRKHQLDFYNNKKKKKKKKKKDMNTRLLIQLIKKTPKEVLLLRKLKQRNAVYVAVVNIQN